MAQHLRTSDVFVAGRTPVITYNPRDERHLESEVRSYLGQTGKALTVSGPTKSGKTVLLERLLPAHEAIWITGSDLKTVDDLWAKIVDWLGLYDMLEVQQSSSTAEGVGVEFQIGVPKVLSAGSKFTDDQTTGSSATYGRTRRLSDVAKEGILALPVPIVIDDFHYVSDDLKIDVTRAVKGLIPHTHVVMIAVPHEAFEAVRAEPDMNGRVWQLSIEPWNEDELRFIARAGFQALGIVDADEAIGTALAANSQGAPFLMQQLCHDFVLGEGVLGTQVPPRELTPPSAWANFFRRVANRMPPGVFDALRKGPNTRGQERAERLLKSGERTDIYGAVLYGIARLGPRSSIRYPVLVRKLEEILVEAPRSHHVTNALGHMAGIAAEARGAGDAALDYKNDTLHILDPFLSFYLRFGDWELPSPPSRDV